jgi:glycosyltransferase involved in cell wall biosynthesis
MNLKNYDISFKFNNNNINKKIKIGIISHCIKNGGRARITSLLINYLDKINIFKIYIFTRLPKELNEYIIPKNIKRIIIKEDFNKIIKKKKINVIIYELDNVEEIILLNKLKKTKVIFYLHSSNFFWLYENFSKFKLIYKAYSHSKYIVSLVPFENDYLFEKWGIKSIIMNNFITYDYHSIIPLDLSSKSILMIGRAKSKGKRFELGIKSMEYILQDIPKCSLLIITNITGIDYHFKLVHNMNLENNIKFIDYISNPEIYYKNVSLHLLPSISEALPLVVCETKIYGIPNILLGLDYISISKGGTIIIFDDKIESISKRIIEILKDEKYRDNLGKEARKSMKIFDNDILSKKWIKLILSVYYGDIYYKKLQKENIKLSKKESLNIFYNQIKLLKMRKKNFINTSLYDYQNLTYFDNFNLIN